MRLRIVNALGRKFDVEIESLTTVRHRNCCIVPLLTPSLHITTPRCPLSPLHLQLDALRRSVAAGLALDLRGPELSRLKLVKAGAALADEAAVAALDDGDTLLAAVAPRPPSRQMRDLVAGADAAEADEEAEITSMVRLQLGPDTPAWQRSIALFLRDRLRVPEALLALTLRAGWRVWAGTAAWMALARAAYHFELGPPFIVGSCFALISWVGFSRRVEGSFSAYSIFNPNVARLPGQLTAEHMDGQLRRGQM